jgi:hypothetical protein
MTPLIRTEESILYEFAGIPIVGEPFHERPLTGYVYESALELLPLQNAVVVNPI